MIMVNPLAEKVRTVSLIRFQQVEFYRIDSNSKAERVHSFPRKI